MTGLGRRVVVPCIVVLFVSAAAFGAPPRFITIDIPGATATVAYGINAPGDIVGGYVTEGKEHGFILRNGAVETFDYPGAAWTEIYGINPQGDAVGQYFLAADRTTHGFLLPAGSTVATPLDVEQPTDVGAANTMPFKISPEGVITGCLHQSNPNGAAFLYTMHGFVTTAGGTTQDPLAGAMHTGNSPSGAVTGHYYVTATSLKSYVIEDGVVTWFSVPGFAITRAYDINPSGAVVGFYRLNTSASSPFHGFLYREGEITTIDVPFAGVTSTRAMGINPQGDIVGQYVLAGVSHGFLMTRRGAE